jgi:hypothetical protein
VTHSRLVHGTEVHRCPACSFRTKSAKYLKKHVASQHAAPRHSCAICHISLASRTELKAHRAAAHPEVCIFVPAYRKDPVLLCLSGLDPLFSNAVSNLLFFKAKVLQNNEIF